MGRESCAAVLSLSQAVGKQQMGHPKPSCLVQAWRSFTNTGGCIPSVLANAWKSHAVLRDAMVVLRGICAVSLCLASSCSRALRLSGCKPTQEAGGTSYRQACMKCRARTLALQPGARCEKTSLQDWLCKKGCPTAGWTDSVAYEVRQEPHKVNG